jgi:hypothetical protein
MEWALSLGVLVAERVVDYALRRHKATRELVRKAARVVFDQVARVVAEDKEAAKMHYRNLLDRGLRAAGIRPSRAIVEMTDLMFDELWEARRRDLWDTAMAELRKAGARAEKLAEALAAGRSPRQMSED